MDIHSLTTRISRYYQVAIEAHSVKDDVALRDALFGIDGLVYENLGYYLTSHVEQTTLLDKILPSPYTVTVNLPDKAHVNVLDTRTFSNFKEGKLKVIDPKDLLAGKLDIKTGAVSGFYSKIRLNLTYSSIMFDGRIDAMGLTTILAHELGHAWELFNTIGVTTATSAMCAGISDFFDRYDNVEDRVKFTRAMVSSVDPKADISPTKDELLIFTTSHMEAHFQRETGLKFSPVESGELLADQFVSKWKLEVSYAKALKALYLNNTVLGRVGLSGKWNGVLSIGYSLMLLPWKALYTQPLGLLTTGGKLMVSGVFAGVSFVFMVLVSFFMGVIRDLISPHGHYPTLTRRLEAIRRNLVSRLSHPNLTNEEKVAITADLDALDLEILSIKDWGNPISHVFSTIADYLRGKRQGENAKTSVAERTNNRLYELAARIETL